MDEETMDELLEAIEVVCFIFLIVIITFGTIGSVISFVIWSRGNKSKTLACSSYFKLLSISDICVLLVPGIYELLRLYPVKYVLTGYSDFLCKSVTFVRLFVTQISAWLVVAVTLERMASTLFPFKYNLDKARKRAYVVGIVICVLALLSNSIFFVGMETKVYNGYQVEFYYFSKGQAYNEGSRSTFRALKVEKDYDFSKTSNTTEMPTSNVDSVSFRNNTTSDKPDETITYIQNSTLSEMADERLAPIGGRYCDFVNLPRDVENVAWTINYIALIFFMPLSIILFSNLTILVLLCCRRTPRNTSQRSNCIAHFTRLVLAIEVVYTLSTLPMAFYVLRHLEYVNGTLDLPDLDVLPVIARSLFCLNNGTNFILYYVSGGNFRKDVKAILKLPVFKFCKHSEEFDLKHYTK